MKSGICKITTAAIALFGSSASLAQDASVEKTDVVPTGEKAAITIAPGHDDSPVIEIALLLDTSNSMDGLIGQAKTQLWSVVNEFITAKQAGKTPVVKVALFEYGKSSLSAESHWIRRIQPLTRDLDKISEELFALRTNGGDEYCGAVIRRAVETLDWSPSKDTYKAIFIAGNEPFTQGPIKASEACKSAITKGIIVNTIHCGSQTDGINGGWKQGALLADGSFLIIDQDQTVAHIEAPQDKLIIELNVKLNGTYVPYGLQAQRSQANQIAQDANSESIARSNLASRARTKASSNYWNPNWDIVDACQVKGFKWEEVKKDQLPENLRKLSTEELKTYVEKQMAERKRIQKEILDLSSKRDAWVAKKRQELGEDNTLGNAVSSAIRAQAGTKGVTFEVRK